MEKELKIGLNGELIVWDKLMRFANVKAVVDVRDDKFFRDCDVDFLVEDVNRQFHWFEIKTDLFAHRSGNIAYEVYSSKTYKTPGCFEKTKAEHIAYYVPGIQKTFLINVGLLRDYVHAINEPLIPMGDNALGHLIPIEELQKRRIIYKTLET